MRRDLFRSRVPDARRGFAYLYVVGFTGGTVKVGRTASPEVRIQQHQRDAMGFGLDITDLWMSEALGDARLAERALIRECSALAGVTSGALREYFQAITFRQAVAIAETITPGLVGDLGFIGHRPSDYDSRHHGVERPARVLTGGISRG
jgi:hypothetical protein